ncbi:SusC/RagA family TonB-linked outer membrane protein [Marivirga sp.]|uniref:SusC/RagA family TonB-linked outer membrane protein n=1 Tax=Marivirga sp. TaxID=2018662 RepID=UPI002D80E735|nr:SusC/RagA family TonB-linked outer membrane protein [Marivirga sp.]HET8860076.1 SusC/RagA family TonB-linked outer membrane protein [Marivirga sp.]
MKKSFLIFILTFLTLQVLFAQNKILRGTVTDAVSGEPLSGVNVLIKEIGKGIITDREGNFKISIPSEIENLLFIYPGKERKEIEVGEYSFVSVELGPIYSQIDEEAHFSFGTLERKYLQPYAYQELEENSINRMGTQSLATVLKGKISSLYVNESSGMPGASAALSLRGNNSVFLNNSPLLIVDGLPIRSDAGFSGLENGMDYSSRINDLNVEDIKTINVLKGASAAALYGSRATNGAIIITTKKGSDLKPGSTRVNVGQSYIVSQAAKLPELQNTFGQGNNGQFNDNSPFSWGENLTEEQAYDNLNPMFQDGSTAISHFDISGRGTKGNYNAAVSYVDQKGVIPTSAMNRITGKLQGELNFNNKFTVGAIANAAVNDISKLAGGNNSSSVLNGTFLSPPSYDLWGDSFASAGNPSQQEYYRPGVDNPRWSLANNDFSETTERIFGSVYFKYQPSKWLQFNYRGGGDFFNENINEIYDLGASYTNGRTTPPAAGRIIEGQNQHQELNSNINAQLTFGNPKRLVFELLLGNETIDIQTNSTVNIGNNLNEAGTQDIDNTDTQSSDTVNYYSRVYGFYANASFSIYNTIYLDFSARQDYISNSNYENGAFIYPSVGMSFVFSQLFEKNNFLNIGKLSANFSNIGQAPFLNQNINQGLNEGLSNPYFAQSRTHYPYLTQGQFFVMDEVLSPQITQTLDLGLDLRLLNNQVGLKLNYFQENNSDQVLLLPEPLTSGVSYRLQNVGEIENRGIEASLSLIPVKRENFEWEISGNYTAIESNVVSISENINQLRLSGGVDGPEIRLVEGESFPMIYGTSFLRNEEGKIVVDGREFIGGISNPSFGMPIEDPNRKSLGKMNPDFWAALSSNIRIYGLSIHAQFDGQLGGHIYAGQTQQQKEYGTDIATSDRAEGVVLDAVKGYYSLDGNGEAVVEADGENNIIINKGEYFWSNVMAGIDEAHVYQNNFVRLRELKIGYTFDHTKGGSGFFKKTNLYVVGRNLWLKSSLPNADPETGWNSNHPYHGQQFLHFPHLRSIGGGINLTF